MPPVSRIAVVQMDVSLGDVPRNRDVILARVAAAAKLGASLVIFPECCLTGYCFDSLAEAEPHAESIPGPSTDAISEACRTRNVHAVIGMLEQDGPRIYNAAVLCGPDGVVARYRKVHLPYLGVDRFTTPGDTPFDVYQVGELRLGINICYDSAFPEAARVMALAGADLIVLPTNFPPGARCMIEHVVHVRAMENAVYYAAANRVGQEREFEFIGQSKICDPDGRVLAEADGAEETILIAEIDLAQARQKRRVRVPGTHEIDRFADRRPEFYGSVVE